MVRDQAAVRLAGAGAAHQGAGRRAVRAAARATARCPRRCRPSRSSRRAPRSRWTRRSGPGRRAATSGSRSPRSTRSRRSARSSRSTASTPARSPASRSPRSATRPPQALRAWGIQPDLVPVRRAVRRRAARGLAAVRRRCSTRSTGSSCRAPTSPPRPSSPGWSSCGWEVDDVTAYRTVRAAPPPAPIREAIKTGKFDAVVFTSSSTVRNLVGIAGKPHAVHGDRGASARPRRRPPRSTACGSTSSRPTPSVDRARRRAGRLRRVAAARQRVEAGEPVAAPSQKRSRRPAARRPEAGVPRPPPRFPAGPAAPAAVDAGAARGWSRETRLGPGRAGAAAVRRGRALTEPRADRVDARRRAAHPRLAAQGGRRGGRGSGVGGVMLFGVPRAARTPTAPGRSTRTASSTSRSATWSPRSATRSW